MSTVIKPATRRRGRGDAGAAAGGGVGGGDGSRRARWLSLRGGMTLFAGLFFGAAFLNSVTYYHTGKALVSLSSSSSSSSSSSATAASAPAAAAGAGAGGGSEGGVFSTLLAAGGGDDGGYLPNFSLSSFMQLPSSLAGGSGEEEEYGAVEVEEEATEPEGPIEGLQVNDLDMEEELRKTKAKLAAEKDAVAAKRAAALEAEKARIQGLRDEDERKRKEAEEANRKALEGEDERKRKEAEEANRKALEGEAERARKAKEEEEKEEKKAKAEAEAKAATEAKAAAEAKAKEEEEKKKAAADAPAADPKGASEAAAEAKAEKTKEETEEVKDPEAAAADKRMRAFFAEEGAWALAWPSAADMARTEEDADVKDVESGVILPVHPAKGVKRAPITGRPPLHRPRGETQIEKILVMFSSTDRGQRIAHMWSGDKMETMTVTMASVAALCERGFDVTAWFIAAWPVEEEDERIREALHCERIKGPIEIKYWDHFPEDIGGKLSSRHRLAVAEVVDDFDFFISIEDDIHLTPLMFDAFVDASNRLALADEKDRYYPGFARKEHDAEKDESWSIWETDAEDYNARFLGPHTGWFAVVGGNLHQAMWMATREQVYHLDARCTNKFFNINEAEAVWVEWWSGALQLWQDCDGLAKAMPVATFRNLTVWHMTDTKLYVRGKGVEPLEDIVGKLEGQRAAIPAGAEAEGAGEAEEEEKRA